MLGQHSNDLSVSPMPMPMRIPDLCLCSDMPRPFFPTKQWHHKKNSLSFISLHPFFSPSWPQISDRKNSNGISDCFILPPFYSVFNPPPLSPLIRHNFLHSLLSRFMVPFGINPILYTKSHHFLSGRHRGLICSWTPMNDSFQFQHFFP
jgi:hypothetical protein